MKLTKRTSYASRHMPQLSQQSGSDTPIGAGHLHYARNTELAREREEYMATANSHNTSVSQLPIEIDVDPLLKDIVFSEDLEQKKLVMRLYSDIYYNHNIAGSIVDIKSQLMFSEFTLGGILDRKVAEDFQENVDRLDIRTLMPEIDVDYNVKGAFVGSLLYNGTTQTFSRIMPHGYENTKIDQLPFHGTDPLITVAFPETVRSTMQSDSPRVKALREFLGADVMKQLSNEALELDPKSTVYVPRRSTSTSTANSYYRRVLPWYLMEKNLFRGTLVRSAMRQKGILHVTLDGAGEWEPTIADMQAVMDMFMNADADPIGAVVATRGGISTEEIRDPTGGWTIFDNKDAIDGYIMKALGIGESLLSGDATFSNQDTSLSFFIDGVRHERDYLTRRTLYNKVFPMISAMKGYVLSNSGKLSTRGNMLDKLDPMGSYERLNDGSRLLIPSVHWEKTLKPEGDQQYMEMLQALTEKGVPVPLRAMTAAGGFNLDRLLATQEADLHVQESVYEYQKKVKELKKKYGLDDDAGGGGGGDMGGFASNQAQYDHMIALANSGQLEQLRDELVAASNQHYDRNFDRTSSDILARGRGSILGLANREYGELSEIAGVTHDGKKRWLTNQKLGNERANRKIVQMIREQQSANKTHNVRRTVTPFIG